MSVVEMGVPDETSTAVRKRPSFWAGVVWLTIGLAAVVVPLYFVLRTVYIVPDEVALENGQQLLTHKRVLAVVAHPDDLEYYVGGSLRILADRGAETPVIVGSNGEKGRNRFTDPEPEYRRSSENETSSASGNSDRVITQEAWEKRKAEIKGMPLGEIRRQEQIAAGDINGYSKIYFFELPDRDVVVGPKFRKKFLEVVREVQPDAIMTFDPTYPSMPYLHRDHQGVGRVVMRWWLELQGEKPDLYLIQSRRPNTIVDISSVIDIKVLAMNQHLSQNGGRAFGMKERMARAGSPFGIQFAETFRKLEP